MNSMPARNGLALLLAAYAGLAVIVYAPFDVGPGAGFWPTTIIALLALSLIMLMLWQGLATGEGLPLYHADIPAALFIAWCSLTLLWSPDIFLSRYGLAKFGAAMMAYAAFARFKFPPEMLRRAGMLLVFFIILTEIHGLLQYFTVGGWHCGRAHAFFTTPNLYAGFLILFMPLLGMAALGLSGPSSWLAGTAFAAAGGALTAAASRGAWLAALAVASGSAAYFIVRERKSPAAGRAGKAAALLLALLLFMVAVAALQPPASGAHLADRAASLSKGVSETEPDRLKYWASAWRIAAAHPLIGRGLHSFSLLYPRFKDPSFSGVKHLYAHNDYLQLLAETGLIGAALFLWWLAAVLAAVSRRRAGRAGPWLAAAALGILAVAFHAAVDFDLYVPGVAMPFFILAGMVVARSGIKPLATIYPPSRLDRRLTTALLIALWLAIALFMVQPALARRYSLRGHRLLASGHRLEALAAYRLAIRLEPSASTFRMDLAEALSGLGEQSADIETLLDAEMAYLRAMAVSPEDASIYALLAQFYSRNLDLLGAGRRPLLADALRRSLALNPDQPGLYRELGRHALALGNLAEAKAALVEYGRRTDDAEGEVLLAKVFLAEGDGRKAAAVLEDLLRRRPDHREAALLLGQARR